MARLWRLGPQGATTSLGTLPSAAYFPRMDASYDLLALENADDFITRALSLLARGVADRRAAFHTLSLATIGLDGTPQLRTVVLRGLDGNAPSLTFHTDKRSPKFAELTRSPAASALAYDAAAKLQIRMNGTVSLRHGDEFTGKIWAGLQRTSQDCYHTPDAPSGSISSAPPLNEDQARQIFCVCTLTITKMDVLYLRAGGHLRATTTGGRAHWVAP
jgi:general stress protein 26